MGVPLSCYVGKRAEHINNGSALALGTLSPNKVNRSQCATGITKAAVKVFYREAKKTVSCEGFK